LEERSWNYKRKRTALLSTGEPERITEQCRSLVKLGWRLIATRETVELMKKKNIPVKDVRHFTGVGYEYGIPPTLHPKIEQALTVDCEDSIDLVFDVPYPLSKGNDIGGRTLLALGAKGGRLVINNYGDLKKTVKLLEQNSTTLDEFRKQLIAKATFEISNHFLTLSRKHSEQFEGLLGKHKMACSEGENPYQTPCDLFTICTNETNAIFQFKQIAGERMNFTNLADMDSIIVTIEKLKQAFLINSNKFPYIVIAAKHGNPCGVGVDWLSKDKAIRKSLWGNPQAIWGGEVICNFCIDDKLANALFKSIKRKKLFGNSNWMLDVIIAPRFSTKAVAILGKRRQRKLVVIPSMNKTTTFSKSWHYRFVQGGFLRQRTDDYALKLSELDWTLTPNIDVDSLFIAWATAYTSFHGGNEVALAKDSMLIGIGGGPSTAMAVQHAVEWAKNLNHKTKGAIFCADAFFPFTDVPENLKKVGCKGGAVPAGGKNHALIYEYFKDKAMKVGFIPEQFRGFCRH